MEEAERDLREQVWNASLIEGLSTPRQVTEMLDLVGRTAKEKKRVASCSWHDERYEHKGSFIIPSWLESPLVNDPRFDEKWDAFTKELGKKHAFTDADIKLLDDSIVFMKDGIETGEITTVNCRVGTTDYILAYCSHARELHIEELDDPRSIGTCKVSGMAYTVLPRAQFNDLLVKDEKKEFDDLIQSMWDDLRRRVLGEE